MSWSRTWGPVRGGVAAFRGAADVCSHCSQDLLKTAAARADKAPVSRFAENAERILAIAESVGATGHTVPEWTILIGPRGGIQMVADSDWHLASLEAERGAGMAFRVSRQRDTVRVEGRAGARTCLFEAGKPNGVARLSPARLLPAEVGSYPVSPFMTGPRPAGMRPLLPAASD